MARADVTIKPGFAPTLFAGIGSGNDNSDLYILNPATGSASSVGTIGNSVTGMAFDPSTEILYGVTAGGSTPNPRALITINMISGEGSVVATMFTGASTGRVIADIAIDRDTGILYGWSENVDDLATINKSTGEVTIVSNSGIDSFGDAMSINSSGTLYLIPEGEGGNIYTVNKTTGAASSTGILVTYDDNGEAFNAGSFSHEDIFYAIYNKEFDGETRPLVTINLSTGQVSKIGDTLSGMDALCWVF